MAITDLTGTKWLLEQGWTATSGFGQFSIYGVVYDTNDSLLLNEINGFNIGYLGVNPDTNLPVAASNGILVNFIPTALTPSYYYEFEITGGDDVTNTTLINWLETNATQIIELSIADKLQELLDIKQDIKTAIENKGSVLTDVDFGGYAGKIDLLPLPKEEQTKTVSSPNFSSGNVVVTPDTGKVLTQVTVVKDNDLIPENIVKDVNIFGVVGTAEAGGGGLTGGYNVVYRSDYLTQVPSWISITLTFIDDTTASYEINSVGGTTPSDWEHYAGDIENGNMVFGKFAPYVWNNVKSVSITAIADGSPYLEINGVNVGKTYTATLNKNILVHNAGGSFGW